MMLICLLIICLTAGAEVSFAANSAQAYINIFSPDNAESIPVKVRGLVAQNGLDPMTLLLEEKVIPGAQVEDGERIGLLSVSPVAQQSLVATMTTSQEAGAAGEPSEIQIVSPCRAKIEEVYCSSNTVVTAENNNVSLKLPTRIHPSFPYFKGAMSPKYILSFSCLSYPGHLIINKKTGDQDGPSEVSIVSGENFLVVDVPDSEYVQQGSVLLGVWTNNQIYLRYEASKAIQNVQTVYPKPQLINQRFGEGATLLRFELPASLETPLTSSDYHQGGYQPQTEPLKEDSTPIPKQSEKEASREPSLGDFEGEQSIRPLDRDIPVGQGDLGLNYVLDSHEPQPLPAKTDLSSAVDQHPNQQIEVALDNSAMTYAIMMRNRLKRSKLHALSQDFHLLYQKPKWIVRAPCSGTITTRMLAPGVKRIAQGTVYASIECSSKRSRGGQSRSKGQEMDLIMPFSIRVGKIKANLQETDEEGLYSIKVSKNQYILSGRLIQESKNVPPHLIYGRFQLVTAPCTGTLRNTSEIGKSVRRKDSVFSVDCIDPREDSVMHGVTTRAGLVTKLFREAGASVKVGEAIAIVRNNWKILTSPCDGVLIYTEGPGLAKTGTNIAVVICNDNKSKRKNIQATKSFMILENILPNPSFVTRKQPLIVVDASKLNWELSEDQDEPNTIKKIYSPTNTKSNLKNPKLPSNVLIQNVVSPCNGYLFREQELKQGSQIDESVPFAKIKCSKSKQYSLSLQAGAVILANTVYEQLGGEMISSYEPESFQVSKGASLLQIMFIHNLKHHVITAPCDGYGYTFTSTGNKVSKGKYFAAIQCKDEQGSKKTQKIKAVKDMKIIASYISFKKKFFKSEPLFITVESSQ